MGTDSLESLEDAEEVTEAHLMGATSFRVGAAIEPMLYSPGSLQLCDNSASQGTPGGSEHPGAQPSGAHTNGSQDGTSSNGVTAPEHLKGGKQGKVRIAILHTGGSLGLCGLAQRFPEEF